MSTKGYRKGDLRLDRTVESLLDITNEYNPQWSNTEYRDLSERFGIVVGMFGEACRTVQEGEPKE